VQTQYQQGVLRRYIGDFEGAERALLEACSAARDFGMRDAHIRALCAIGGLYNQLERYEEANEHLTRALALQRGEKISKSTEEIALTLNAMAVALFYQGDYQRAILCLEEANVDVRKWLGEGHVLEGVILVNASEVYRKLRRDEEADAAKEKGMSILQRCLDADHAAFSEAPGVVTVQFRSKKTTYVADLVVVG